MKIKRKRKSPAAPAETPELPERLAELHRELNALSIQDEGPSSASLATMTHVEKSRIKQSAVLQFRHGNQTFAVGHADSLFAGTNGARGMRRIHFYDAKQNLVLEIACSFEKHSYGSSYAAPQLVTHHPGDWEAAFMTLTTGLREFRADRKEELRRLRAKAAQRS